MTLAPYQQTAAPMLPSPEADHLERQLNEIISRTDLSKKEKLRLLRKQGKRADAKIAELDAERRELRRKMDRLNLIDAARAEIVPWANGTLGLERATGSQVHSLQSDAENERVLHIDEVYDRPIESIGVVVADAQAFVIEHDWARAFANAKDYDSHHFKMPFDVCCFEFVINSRRVIAVAMHTSDDVGGDVVMKPFVRATSGWFEGTYIYRHTEGAWSPDRFSSEGDVYRSLSQLIGDQIKAICVALDAEVAAADVVRAPEKLVRARLRERRVPPVDYHVVSLSRKPRATILPVSDSSAIGPKRRLHFRRGHWRHYETHKTWIRWCLVGDPDLGFIDKHYKL